MGFSLRFGGVVGTGPAREQDAATKRTIPVLGGVKHTFVTCGGDELTTLITRDSSFSALSPAARATTPPPRPAG